MIDRSLNYGRHLIHKFLAGVNNFRTVLDIGAGQGTDLFLAKKINSEAFLYAVELNPEYIRHLREKSISVYELDIEHQRLPFANSSVDVVIANQVLEHTKEIFWIFHEITRVLRIGGITIIGLPNLASFHNRILLLIGRQPSQIKTNSAHIRGFTKEDF